MQLSQMGDSRLALRVLGCGGRGGEAGTVPGVTPGEIQQDLCPLSPVLFQPLADTEPHPAVWVLRDGQCQGQEQGRVLNQES